MFDSKSVFKQKGFLRKLTSLSYKIQSVKSFLVELNIFIYGNCTSYLSFVQQGEIS